MGKFSLDKDISDFCMDAETFPDVVLKAHQTLHSLIPFSAERNYFGYLGWKAEKLGISSCGGAIVFC